MQRHIGATLVELVEGDIAEQQTDAVVTAAHWDLRGGAGTDGAIHSRAGPDLLRACRRIGGCAIGGAVITDAYDLPARYVIHAVGPVYTRAGDDAQRLLASAYTSSLQRAAEHALLSVAIPLISTGAYGFPLREAAPIAMDAITGFLRDCVHSLELVRVVLYPREQRAAYSIFAEAARRIRWTP